MQLSRALIGLFVSSNARSRQSRAHPWRAVGVALCSMLGASGARAQSEIRSLAGATGEQLGAAICDAGDVNGDGWNDYMVGAPAANGGRGGVICISGKYLATGLAPAQLFSCYPSVGQVSADAAFGSSIAKLGDITGDNIPDFAVGAPNADVNGFTDCGAVYVVDGATHNLTAGRHSNGAGGEHEGWSIFAAGDCDGDGWPDLLAGSASASSAGKVWLLSGRSFTSSQVVVIRQFNAPYSWMGSGDLFGYAVLGGVDYNGDGVGDFVITAPGVGVGAADCGVVRILAGPLGTPVIADYFGLAGHGLGTSLATGADFDGDGHWDLVVGENENSTGTWDGEVVVLSLQHLISGVPPFEIFAWDGPPQGGGIGTVSAQFGASVAVAPDLNGDGQADVLVGAPRLGWTLSSHGGGNYGAVAIYSGSTGAQIGWLSGATNERIGSAVLGSSNDLDGDGHFDFLVGGTGATVPTSNCGVFEAVRLFPTTPVKYCIGKVNSLGCTPAIEFSGSASMTSASPFAIGASNVINNKNGLLFYGFGPLANLFQGGVLCVEAPTVRTVVQNSGGSAAGNDCTGTFSLDFNTFIQAGGHPQLVTGKEVFCQYWSRDPQSPSTTSLSDALSFVINP